MGMQGLSLNTATDTRGLESVCGVRGRLLSFALLLLRRRLRAVPSLPRLGAE